MQTSPEEGMDQENIWLHPKVPNIIQSDHNLKFLIINCQSIRSQSKRNELAALLLYHNIDIVLGNAINASHIDSSYSSSEILPSSYKVIRKDCSLGGGGGVFIGFSNSLNISELSNTSSEAEMVLAKLQLPNNKSLYLCSFYRSPNNNVTPITKLNDFLSSIFYNESPQLPQILLAGDFNLPSISWIDGQIKPNPTYGTDVNQSLLESINEFAPDQLVTEPTRGRNTLDLIFSSHPESISKMKVIPGICDHEAVYCKLILPRAAE